MPGIKILNDPIYGFIMVPKGLILDLVDHPWFQRLRRIKQLGLGCYIYPGAVHSRFHHALGVFHLATQAIEILRQKSHPVTREEAEAVTIAALLHDVGHGPFSHVLEHSLVPLEHEKLTLWIMEALNEDLKGRLDLAIEIFKGNYHKSFLCKLVASQLDLDRMDYLNRDSFYSGVVEGTIGYHRLLTMMDVEEGKLVFEEKAGLSIENYLGARRLMYWQVYMHKTSVSAENMLQSLLARCKQLQLNRFASPALEYFIALDRHLDWKSQTEYLLNQFQKIDDTDVEMFLKCCQYADDPMVSFLAKGLIQREFFKVEVLDKAIDEESLLKRKHMCIEQLGWHVDEANDLVQLNKIDFNAYEKGDQEIWIRTKKNEIVPASEILSLQHLSNVESRYYLCYPKATGLGKLS